MATVLTRKAMQATRRRGDDAPRPLRAWSLRLAFVALLAAPLAGGLWWVYQPDRLPLTTLRVSGAFARVAAEDVQRVAAARIAGGFFGADLARLRRELEALPWVHRASVRRLFPDTLHVTIDEQQPLARWAGGGFVNRQGQRFDAPPALAPTDLAELQGPDGQEALLAQRYRAFRAALDPLGLTVRRVVLDERRAWSVQLADQVELALGRDDAERRLQRFVRVWPDALASRAGGIARIDLRYANGFTVRWRKGEAHGGGRTLNTRSPVALRDPGSHTGDSTG